MALTLSLPVLDSHPAHPPETRPAKVAAWLASMAVGDPVQAARAVADAIGATNRINVNERRRFELAEKYWAAARQLWPLLERRFIQVSHPLSGDGLEAARALLALAHELSVTYKLLLAREADRRLVLGGNRHLATLLQRSLQSITRTITSSYLAYSPVPANTWLDAHRIYAFAHDRGLHQVGMAEDAGRTPERAYVKVLLVALANPYGFAPGQLATVLRYLDANVQWAKLTDVQPVHRMAKAVAIVPVGHDFPPFSANKGGAIEGRKMFLLTFELAFQMQEQLRALEAGGEPPPGIGRDVASRRSYVALVKRLLRQWAIPPARQFNRVPSKAPVTICTGLPEIWKYVRAITERNGGLESPLPAAARCEVINHTPAGYALRQLDTRTTTLRIGELVAIAVEGRGALQVAIVRWFRNSLHASALEFGCELLSDAPAFAKATAEGSAGGGRVPVLVLPEQRGRGGDALAQVVVPADAVRVEQAITLERDGATSFAVLTKLVEQGAGFEVYDFVAVG
ncbi:MAG: hypothetical protein ABI920_00785 [Casimicrobiaceae bacterium]